LFCDVAFVTTDVLLGSFRSLSPLNAANDNSTHCGDHGRQVETSPAAQVVSQLQRGFGDRGDAHHVSEHTRHESKSLPSARIVSHVPAVEISNLHRGKAFSSLDIGLTVKLVQPQEESDSSTAIKSHSEYKSSDADQTTSHVTTMSQTNQNVLPISVSSIDKHLNWEALFMPYRRNADAQQTSQPEPVAVPKKNKSAESAYLATLYEGFSETCLRQFSEDEIARPDDTSIWVISCEISMTCLRNDLI